MISQVNDLKPHKPAMKFKGKMFSVILTEFLQVRNLIGWPLIAGNVIFFLNLYFEKESSEKAVISFTQEVIECQDFPN